MATHQLHLLPLGKILSPAPGAGEVGISQVVAYLIRTAGGRTILVDTGNPSALIGKSTAEPWSDLGLEMTPENDVVSLLDRMGIRPKDVDLVISTHFDWDHCGRHDAFAEAGVPSMVQARHLDWAREHPERYDPELWDHPGMRWEIVSGDTEIERGLAVIETSGHAIGHQSLYVETASGPIVLAIDAISRPSLAQTRILPDWYDDTEEALQSIDKLMGIALEARAHVIYGHEWSQWITLPHAPRAFSR